MKTIHWHIKKSFLLLSLLFFPLSLLTFVAFSFINFSFNEETQLLLEYKDIAAMKKPFQIGSVWFDRMNFAEDTNASYDGQRLSPLLERGIDPTALYDLLPHLITKKVNHLNARVILKTKRLIRSPPELLLLIPSTHRKKHNYLIDTLRNLFANIGENEKHLVLIVVVLSENTWDKNSDELLRATTSEIKNSFGTEVRQGLIEVIAPPQEWFPPNLDNIPSTLGDPPDRMRWRTKQNLDYAYAMFHVRKERPEARFYVQLEDDVITVPGFVSELHRFANAHPDFFMCEFANLGFIGRMFHNGEDLVHLAHFILLLYRSQPVDWVLSKYITSKFCSLDETDKQCMKKRVYNVVLFRRGPPLFQHIGRHSSLPGKLQNWNEQRFSRNKAIAPLRNQNPPFDELRSEIGSTKPWHAFYEENMPVTLQVTHLKHNDDGLFLVEYGYGRNPMAELRGLRLFFSVRFSANFSLIPLPNSLLRVRILHSVPPPFSPSSSSLTAVSSSSFNSSSSSDDSFLFSSFPPPNSAPLYDYFLLIAEPTLRNIRAIHISLTGGDWTKAIDHFSLTAIRIVT